MEMCLTELAPQEDLPEIRFRGISLDSRKINEGDLFICLSGSEYDGRDFINEAMSKGAVAVISEKPCEAEVASDVPVFKVSNLRERVGEYASRFYRKPSAEMEIIAVTGTNGKTTVTHILAELASSMRFRCGLIGSRGYGEIETLSDAELTTPDAVSLQRILRELLDVGCGYVFMEASSHGIDQDRLSGTEVDIAVLTNITQDHLDYHDSMETYRCTKARLFAMKSVNRAVINLDDGFAHDLLKRLPSSVDIRTYSRVSSADVYLLSSDFHEEGMLLEISCAGFVFSADIPLFGNFNVENILAVVATLNSMGWDGKDISKAMEHVSCVSGRMELISAEDKPLVFLDYAHTPDGLKQALAAIRQHYKNRKLICLFGCGGDRDISKRSVMGKIASDIADEIILTNDNPRQEDPETIIRDIASGILGDYRSELDRSKAIHRTISEAAQEDVILIAGKGREAFQEISSKKIPYEDFKVISRALGGLEDV